MTTSVDGGDAVDAVASNDNFTIYVLVFAVARLRGQVRGHVVTGEHVAGIADVLHVAADAASVDLDVDLSLVIHEHLVVSQDAPRGSGGDEVAFATFADLLAVDSGGVVGSEEPVDLSELVDLAEAVGLLRFAALLYEPCIGFHVEADGRSAAGEVGEEGGEFVAGDGVHLISLWEESGCLAREWRGFTLRD